MNESEAMAVLASARGISYLQREHALARAGSALALLADPGAFGHELGEQGIFLHYARLCQALGK